MEPENTITSEETELNEETCHQESLLTTEHAEQVSLRNYVNRKPWAQRLAT